MFFLLKLERLAGFDLCYNWGVRSLLLEKIHIPVRVVDNAAKFRYVCKPLEFVAKSVFIGFVAHRR